MTKSEIRMTKEIRMTNDEGESSGDDELAAGGFDLLLMILR